MFAQKQTIRKAIAGLKKQHKDSDLADLSEKIFSQIEQSSLFLHSQTILLYHSLNDEVKTHSFIDKWYKKKNILLPVVINEELELRLYTGKANLKIGKFDILEPEGDLWSDYSKIDMAIIPGVAFDTSGNRLGRGKGFYDRLLPALECHKVGICFSFQLLNNIPHESHDIKMNYIFTERDSITCF